MPQSGPADKPQPPLAGIRVLDFGQFIAGPVCAALLADLGADVIRVESVEGGIDRFLTPLGDGLPGALYATANRTKRSLALNLRDPEARRILARLLPTCDVVVSNMPQKTLERLGLDGESLQRVDPSIVSSNCTAYGNRGPWKVRPGFDGMAQAMSGAMHMSGADGEPRKSYVHFVDFFTAALSALGVLAALYERVGTGAGRSLQNSLLGSALMMMNSALAEEAALELGRTGTGNRGQTAGPADVFDTSDGKIILQVVGERMFGELANLIGKPELVDEPAFRDDSARGENSLRLNEFVRPWCASRTTDDCIDALSAVGLCASPVLSLDETLAHAQIQQHPARHEVHHDDAAVPLFVPLGGDAAAPTPAPPLGAHSREILRELDYTDAELDALHAAGVIRVA